MDGSPLIPPTLLPSPGPRRRKRQMIGLKERDRTRVGDGPGDGKRENERRRFQSININHRANSSRFLLLYWMPIPRVYTPYSDCANFVRARARFLVPRQSIYGLCYRSNGMKGRLSDLSRALHSLIFFFTDAFSLKVDAFHLSRKSPAGSKRDSP